MASGTCVSTMSPTPASSSPPTRWSASPPPHLRLRPASLRGARSLHQRGRHPRPRADGRGGGGGQRGARTSRPGTAWSFPSTSPVARAGSHRQLHSQCDTTQNREQDKGASLFGYTLLYGEVPGGQAEYPARPAGPLRAHQGSRRGRPTAVTSSCPTCCPPRGRPSRTPMSRRAEPWGSGASARSVRCVPGSPSPGGRPGDRGRPGAREAGYGRTARD